MKYIILLLICGFANAQITLTVSGTTYNVIADTEFDIGTSIAYIEGSESCASTNSMVSLELPAPISVLGSFPRDNFGRSSFTSVNTGDERWVIYNTRSSNVIRDVELRFDGEVIQNFRGSAGIIAAERYAHNYIIQIQLNQMLSETGFVIAEFRPTTYADGSRCSNWCDYLFRAVRPGEDFTLEIITRGSSRQINVMSSDNTRMLTYISTEEEFNSKMSEAVNYINNN